MVKLFKENSPIATIWLVVLSLVVHSHFFVNFPGVHTPLNDGLFSYILSQYVAPLNQAVVLIIYHCLIIAQALRLNYLFSENKMFSRANYLVAMVYILLTGIFKEWSTLTPALLENLLVIWLYAQTIKLYNAPDPKTLLFNTGLIIGISIIFYHPSALLIIVALFALMVVRPFVVTEWLVMLMGVLSPLYFLASWLYLTDKLKTFKQYIPVWRLNLPDTVVNPWFVATVALIIVILLIGVFYYQRESRRLLIHVRKNWGVLMVMLLVMLPIPFINKDAKIDSLFLWIIPASPFIAKGFLAPKNNFLPNLMFWSLLLLGLFKNWAVY